VAATLRYNTFRLAMVIVVGAICYVFGARGLLCFALALVISMPLSYVLLGRWRRAMIDELADRGRRVDVQRFNVVRRVEARIEAANDAEDAAIDAAADVSPTSEPPQTA